MPSKAASWNTEELFLLARENYGEKHVSDLQAYLNSISKRIRMAAYHSLESRDMLKGFFTHETEIENYEQGFDLIFGHMTANIEEEEKEKSVLFHNVLWKAEAHVIACAHAIHSLIDIMAQVINSGLNLKINENDVTINKVKQASVKYTKIYSLLTELTDREEYKYLVAFANSQKHIFCVPATFTIQMEVKVGERAYGLKIPNFTFKTSHYAEKWSDDLVVKDFVILKDRLINIGIEINKTLKDKKSLL